jgi:hypothetical protein
MSRIKGFILGVSGDFTVDLLGYMMDQYGVDLIGYNGIIFLNL